MADDDELLKEIFELCMYGWITYRRRAKKCLALLDKMEMRLLCGEGAPSFLGQTKSPEERFDKALIICQEVRKLVEAESARKLDRNWNRWCNRKVSLEGIIHAADLPKKLLDCYMSDLRIFNPPAPARSYKDYVSGRYTRGGSELPEEASLWIDS